MVNNKKAFQTSHYKNTNFLALTCVYSVLLLLFSSLACFFSYRQKKEELTNQMNMTFVQLEQEYQNIIDNFWQIYMPIFETDSNTYTSLANYFVTDNGTYLEPMEKLELSQALQQMLMRDNQVQWIALFSEKRDVNYIIFKDGGSLQVMPPDFPYLDKLHEKSMQMEIYEMNTISGPSSTMHTFAICGGVPAVMGSGKILAGYDTSSLVQICNASSSPLNTLNYVLTHQNAILFDSSGSYSPDSLYLPDSEEHGVIKNQSGGPLYVNAVVRGTKHSVIGYSASWWEIFRYSHQNTLPILLIVLLFTALSVVVYLSMLKMIGKEVDTIREGLGKIGENNLDYRIPANFRQSGLPEIAQSINQMTRRLKENINRAYYYELKQKEAELSELQSKFNPHFLYNTLEMLRSRCYQNGDDKTADLITQLASIFRGFISSKTFIPMPEELTFSKRYLALFGARYGDKVKVRYDIDKEVLQYGIIRNVFQPLIENYFVHGFDTSENENIILFSGRILDNTAMLLTVEDNGSGMAEEEMAQLNARLQEPIQVDTESYGLKNLHQRLQLFYGGDCGLSIERNEGKGICIRMKILRMTMEEYEGYRVKTDLLQ